MKTKSIPEDFRVDELATWDSDPDGEYSIYKVRKRKLTSFEAIDLIREATELEGDDITYAGLKDKQAISTQYVALKNRRIKKRIPGLHTTFIERAKNPLSSKNLLGNKFTIVIRELVPDDAKKAVSHAKQLEKVGLANYYDDQRFGSIRAGQGFVARDMITGDYESALKRLIAVPGHFDPGAELSRKAIIRRYWGQWSTICSKVRGSPNQSILEDLRRYPGDFRTVLDKMPSRLRAVHLLAYQAYLWNEMVGRFLQDRFPPWNLCQSFYSCDRHIFWKDCQAQYERTFKELETLNVPMLNDGTMIKDKFLQNALNQTLRAEGIQQRRLKLKDFRSAFYLEVPRPIMLRPKNLKVSEIDTDDRNKYQKKLTIEFELPPGAYATLVLKRLFKTRDFEEEHKYERSWLGDLNFDHRGQTLRSEEEQPHQKPSRYKTKPEEKKAKAEEKKPKVEKKSKAKSKHKRKDKTPEKILAKQEAQKAEAEGVEANPGGEADKTGDPGLSKAEKKALKRKRKKQEARKIQWKGLGARKERKEKREKNKDKKKPKAKVSLRQKKRKEKRKNKESKQEQSPPKTEDKSE